VGVSERRGGAKGRSTGLSLPLSDGYLNRHIYPSPCERRRRDSNARAQTGNKKLATV